MRAWCWPAAPRVTERRHSGCSHPCILDHPSDFVLPTCVPALPRCIERPTHHCFSPRLISPCVIAPLPPCRQPCAPARAELYFLSQFARSDPHPQPASKRDRGGGRPTQKARGGRRALAASRALLRSAMAFGRALGLLAALLLLLAAGAASKPAKRSSQGPNWTEGECRGDERRTWMHQQARSKRGGAPAAHLPPALACNQPATPAAAAARCSVQHADGAHRAGPQPRILCGCAHVLGPRPDRGRRRPAPPAALPAAPERAVVSGWGRRLGLQHAPLQGVEWLLSTACEWHCREYAALAVHSTPGHRSTLVSQVGGGAAGAGRAAV